MKQSLKKQLNDLIRAKGQVEYNEIKRLCESGYFGKYYRMTTAERRLRKSESPDIEEVMQNGYILSYKAKNPIQYRTARVLGIEGEVLREIRLPI